jgi:hypothetical protein
VTNRSSLSVDTDEIAAQIFASRLRYLQLLARSKALMARAEDALRAEPALLSSAYHAVARRQAAGVSSKRAGGMRVNQITGIF